MRWYLISAAIFIQLFFIMDFFHVFSRESDFFLLSVCILSIIVLLQAEYDIVTSSVLNSATKSATIGIIFQEGTNEFFMQNPIKQQFYKQRADFVKDARLRDERLHMPDDVIVQHDIPYLNDGNPAHRLDIYRPARAARKTLPVIINVHGGGLLLGSKEFNRYFCARLCKLGYVIFSVEYRLIPDCQIYDQFADVSAAICFIHDNLRTYNGNPQKIYGVADSGGACLLTYVTAMSHSRKVADAAHVTKPPVSFRALGLISGMFYTTRFDKIGLFLPDYLYGKHYRKLPFAPYTNPEHPDIVRALPPCFLVTSHNDYLKRYTTNYTHALSRYHIPHKLLCYPKNKKLTHAFSVFEPDLPESMETITAMHRYFRRH